MRRELGHFDHNPNEDIEDRRRRKRHAMLRRICATCGWTPRRLAEQSTDTLIERFESVCGQDVKHVDRARLPEWVAEYVTASADG